MNQTYTLTLTRWHKVAERLARDYGESVSECRSTLMHTEISAYLGEEQEQFLQTQKQNALGNLERAFRIQDAVAHIRHLVGDANVREGVSAKLAEFDKLNRRVKTLSEVVDGQNPGESRGWEGCRLCRGVSSAFLRGHERELKATTELGMPFAVDTSDTQNFVGCLSDVQSRRESPGARKPYRSGC